MTTMPPATGHAAHDPLLVAAHAAGDAAGADLARAAALVASCPDCAALHRDLRALPAALASAPAPSRPRGFRLSAEDAEALRRPAGWRRLLAPLAGARSAAGPVAASLAALGVAGLLLSGSLGGLTLGGAATAGRAPSAADQGGTVTGVASSSGPLAPESTGVVTTDGVDLGPTLGPKFSLPSAVPSAAASAAASPEPTAAPSIAGADASAAASAPTSTANPTATPWAAVSRDQAIAIARTARPDYAKEKVLDVRLGHYAELGNPYGAVTGLSPAPDDLVWLVNLGWILGPLNGQGVFILVDATDGHVIQTSDWIS